jgi:hypothetical protein
MITEALLRCNFSVNSATVAIFAAVGIILYLLSLPNGFGCNKKTSALAEVLRIQVRENADQP